MSQEAAETTVPTTEQVVNDSNIPSLVVETTSQELETTSQAPQTVPQKDVVDEEEVVVFEEEEPTTASTATPDEVGQTTSILQNRIQQFRDSAKSVWTSPRFTFRSEPSEASDVSETSSQVSSSQVSGSQVSSYESSAPKLREFAEKWVDSVQTFRGRYNNTTSDAPPIPEEIVESPTNTAQNPYAHLNDNLEDYQYSLLLGRGMLGVNLKQCFKRVGTYVDYLVDGGQAQASQLVEIGDVVLKVGDESVTQQTIATVPNMIAQAPRPLHMVLEYSGNHAHWNWVDVCVGLFHLAHDDGLPTIPDFVWESLGDEPPPDLVELVQSAATLRNTDICFSATKLNEHPDLHKVLRHAIGLLIADGRRRSFWKLNGFSFLCQVFDFEQEFDYLDSATRQEAALAIARSYLVPQVTEDGTLEPPTSDIHGLVRDQTLRDLERTLDGQVTKDVFAETRQQILDSSIIPMRDFIVSADCARMRSYLRSTAPYQPHEFPQTMDESEKNYVLYILLFLLCWTDIPEGFGENDLVLLEEHGVRHHNATAVLCAALWIQFKLSPEHWETFWQIFLAPGVGCLPDAMVQDLRSSIEELRGLDAKERAAQLESVSMKARLEKLSNECIREFVRTQQPHFRKHKFHEWYCEEIAATGTLPEGCIKRLMRRVDFPVGVTPHQPSHERKPSASSAVKHVNAEAAIVFGNARKMSMIDPMNQGMERYMACSLVDGLAPEEIPPTLESYAYVPFVVNQAHRPLSDDEYTVSSDGWKVRLFTFILPQADTGEGDSSLYAVSMVFQRSGEFTDEPKDLALPPCYGEAVSQLSDMVSTSQTWQEQVTTNDADPSSTLGVVLVSRSNSVLAMREALSGCLRAYQSESKACGNLVRVLGTFVDYGVSEANLKLVLDPFLQESSAPWIQRPVGSQNDLFLQLAGKQLLRSLPPIPLALLFITMLLEQKIVLSSSRRSLLYSVSLAVSELLKPLAWCHLHLPLAPATLAGDLLQYPAPFILGLASEDPGVVDLIRELPDDVTLVDLDVGRVILAPSFAHDNEIGRDGETPESTMRTIRSQVLFLAQCLGGKFGAAIDPMTWSGDNPSTTTHFSDEAPTSLSEYDSLRRVSHFFIEELLAGVSSCCYWIQETSVDGVRSPTILLDEDRFFSIKDSRNGQGHQRMFDKSPQPCNMAIPRDSFDHVIALFLRCQSINDYISSRDHEEMMFTW